MFPVNLTHVIGAGLFHISFHIFPYRVSPHFSILVTVKMVEHQLKTTLVLQEFFVRDVHETL